MILKLRRIHFNSKKIIVLFLLIIEFFLIFLSVKSYNNKNLDKYVFGISQEINKNMMAIMMEDDLDKYIPTDLERLPGLPYVYNKKHSACVDSDGNIMDIIG